MMRLALLLALAVVAGCGVRPTGPAGEPSSSNVNPITGTRGGSSASSNK